MRRTIGPQKCMWTLVAPDGRTWRARSPLRCLMAEQKQRIPANVRLQNIRAAMADKG